MFNLQFSEETKVSAFHIYTFGSPAPVSLTLYTPSYLADD